MTAGPPRPCSSSQAATLAIDAGEVDVLLVSPETAEQLAHAAAFGQITVTIAPLDAV